MENDGKYNFLNDTSMIFIAILFIISFSIPLIWMHGRIIYFWDGILPLKTGSDFHYLNFYWNQLHGLGYVSSIDKYNVYILSYYVLQIFTHNIAITQYLLLSFLIALSTIGMYFLLKHLSLLSNNRINNVFPFIGALFYILNFYFMQTFSDFYINIYIYSMLPFDILIFSRMLESINNTKKFIIYTVFFVFAIEITSYSFLLVPMLALFVFILIAFVIIFYRYIFKSKFNLLKTVENFLIFILIFITTNIWWISSYFINFKSEYASTKATNTGVIISLFTTNLYNPLKLLNIISIYPIVHPFKYSPGFLWNIYYSPKFFLFPILAVLVFLIILFPLIPISNKKTIFNRSIKIKLYVFTFITLFFALQGMNPINRYLFYLIKDYFPQFLTYLYATRISFMRVPILFFYTIIFYNSIYELFYLNLNPKNKKNPVSHQNLTNKLNNKKFRMYFIIAILIFILIIYPFYIYTPSATYVYDTGHGNIPEKVVFPKYFYSLSNYINKYANNSDTLILPLTYSMLSMNFSKGNAFADDNYGGLLFGSPVIIGQNQNLYNLINKNISTPESNFSILLNNINVKYIILNTIFDKYVHGYGYQEVTNISLLNKYIENQKGLQFIKSFGPLILYKNIYYNGIINSSTAVGNNFNLSGEGEYYGYNNTSVVPNICYKEINPTLYKVNIKNATTSFAIMLKQNYNINWNIKGLNNNTYYHYKVDLYGNGWVINRSGNYTFYIVFSPQKVYNEVNDIAITSNIVSLGTLVSIFFYIRKKNK